MRELKENGEKTSASLYHVGPRLDDEKESPKSFVDTVKTGESIVLLNLLAVVSMARMNKVYALFLSFQNSDLIFHGQDHGGKERL